MRRLVLTSAFLFTVALAPPAAQAAPPTGNRADHRLDRRGDRIDRRRGGEAD